MYSKTCLKQPFSKRPKFCFQDQLSLNAGQKYCRMLHGEHSAILSTFIKLLFVIKIFVLSIFEWLLKTGFTVLPSKFSDRIYLDLFPANRDNCHLLFLLFMYFGGLYCKQYGPRSDRSSLIRVHCVCFLDKSSLMCFDVCSRRNMQTTFSGPKLSTG